MAPDTATLDPERIALLRELDDGGIELLTSLAHAFEQDVREQLAAARSALTAADADALRRSAHTMKGAGVNLGAVALAETSSDLEQRAPALDVDVVEPLLAALASELDQVMAALRQILTEA